MIRRIWATLLAALGFVLLFQLSDVIARGLLWLHENYGLQGQGVPPPNLDQFISQQPMVGAVLFVGGLVLWFMPREARF
ncbi:MAG: hypothetical protein ACREFI_12190 [Stellaceae bacterium]